PITMSPRRPSNACASMRAARPLPYVSAASKKVTPCLSCARRSIATASASLRSPHQPVDSVQVPKPTSDTLTSAPGKFLYLIDSNLVEYLGDVDSRSRSCYQTPHLHSY